MDIHLNVAVSGARAAERVAPGAPRDTTPEAAPTQDGATISNTTPSATPAAPPATPAQISAGAAGHAGLQTVVITTASTAPPVVAAAMNAVPEAALRPDNGALMATPGLDDLLGQIGASLDENGKVWLVGDPGSGKTAALRTWAQQNGVSYHILHAHSTMEASDLVGRYTPGGPHGFEFSPAEFARDVAAGKLVVISDPGLLPVDASFSWPV